VVSDLKDDCQVSIGINVSPPSIRPASLTPDELCQFVRTIRQSGATGTVLFHAGIFTDQYASALRAGPFTQPASAPRPKRLDKTK
jgi:hypothetical protein